MSDASVEIYLQYNAPDDPAAVAEVAAKVSGVYVLWERKLDQKQIAEAICHHWQPRSGASRESITKAVEAEVERRAEQRAESEARYERKQAEIERKRKAAKAAEREAEERKEAAKAKRAADVRSIMKEFNVGRWQANDLLKNGTTMPERAKRLAAITGRKASEFYRAPSRPGRTINYVGIFTRPRFYVTSFEEFAKCDQEEFEIEATALDVFQAIVAERVIFDDHKQFTAFTRALGLNGDDAAAVWREYERYCVRTLSGLALTQLREEEEAEADFG